MAPVDLETRTTEFALRVIKVFSALPKTTEAQVLGKQLRRCGSRLGRITEKPDERNQLRTSSARSKALQELDETGYWLQLNEKSEILSAKRLAALHDEANEITKILVTVVKRAKEK